MDDILYVTGLTGDGIPLIGGLWRMKTQMGFPLDLSLMEVCERKSLPDWMELLADAGSANLPACEFDTALQEIGIVAPDLVEEIKKRFTVWFDQCGNPRPDETFDLVCKRLVQMKRDKSVAG